ncbi:MAG TPA: sigma 54-interacting transcriptional regulator [Terriglobales bacterium]|nr:sigma 54-interacting transcriptional regulator [Terriglobales bacterium]
MDTTDQPLVLVIDDREDLSRFCERSLGHAYAFRRVGGARAAAPVLRGEDVAAVLLDRDFSHADPADLLGPKEDARDEGLAILRWLRREWPRVPVLMVTGYRDLQVALQAADLGADFLAWEDVSADPAVLEARLRRALECSGEQEGAVLARFRELGIVAESPPITRALLALHRAIPGRAPILLLGETGTGKDTLAYAAHALMGDPLRPYVGVNVASLNPGIIENELFGHVKGAYTGADRDSLGTIRSAHGGTLFLNEVGDLSADIQVKLLTVLERNEVVPIGGVRAEPAEFRLVTATSRELHAAVEGGTFRRDLYHRIAWHTIAIPPLRERREDIPALAQAFLRATPQHRQGVVFGIAREAMEYLVGLPWEGNIRELRGLVEAACAGARHVVTVGDVREIVRRHESLLAESGGAAAAQAPGPAGVGPRGCGEEEIFGHASYDQLTAAYFEYLMRRTGGRLSEVADLADIAKTTAYEWRKRYGGEPPSGGRAENRREPHPDRDE